MRRKTKRRRRWWPPSKLGFQVRQDDDIFRALSPFERRKLAADIDKAACVLVLWSREAADAPALPRRRRARQSLRQARLRLGGARLRQLPRLRNQEYLPARATRWAPRK